MVLAILIVLIGYGLIQVYKDNPIVIYLWFWVIIIAFIVFTYFLITKKRRWYLKLQTLDQMKAMHWRDFEKFIAFVFKVKWYKAKERQGTSDWWIDVDATKDWQRYAIQCKKWKDYKIWVVDLRAFVWAVDAVWENVIGIYITTSRLTKDAQEYVKIMSHKLEIWDADNLEEYIRVFTWKQEVANIIKKEVISKKHIICKKCGVEMVKREAHQWAHKWEKFYWCSNYPKCRYIESIS
jgi:HJR/Mrr/RecB family endonuclease